MDLVAQADWVIDIGPVPAMRAARIVAARHAGKAREKTKGSITAKYLQESLG